MDDAGVRLLPWPQTRVNLEVGCPVFKTTCALDLYTSLTKAEPQFLSITPVLLAWRTGPVQRDALTSSATVFRSSVSQA